MTPIRARIVLAALLVLFVAAELAPDIRPVVSPEVMASAGGGDGSLFEAVVNRVRRGEPYYPSMGAELRQRHYPTVSVFNWRTPALYTFMAVAPRWTRSVVFLGLSIVALSLSALHLSRTDAVYGVLLGMLAQAGAIAAMASPVGQLQTETWAGVIIAISAMAYARRAWVVGALVGLLALLVRELAAPFCVVAFLLAVRGRRTSELWVWLAGGAVYTLFYAMHVSQVWGQHQLGDAGHPQSWIQWGGLPFVLETIRETNGALLISARVVAAATIVLLAAALWAPTLPPHVRGTVIAYGLLFAVVGFPFNDYWGFVTAPTYAVVLAYGPRGLSMLFMLSGRPGKSPRS